VNRDEIRERVTAALRGCIQDGGISYEEMAECAVATVEDALGDHVVVFHPDSWYTEHSLACRLEGMEFCAIHGAMMEQITGPEKAPGLGRYTATLVDGQLQFTGT
jgi:hypothetical protein